MGHPEENLHGEQRVIGRVAALAVVAGSMLGIGIFLSPRIVAEHVPYLWGYLGVWLLGGIVALSGAGAYGELGAMFPESGGDYVFLDEAFGRSVAVAGGWLLFFGIFCGSIATMTVAIGQYQIPVVLEPWLAVKPEHVLLAVGGFELTFATACALAIVAFLTSLNVLGTRLSTGVQVVVTTLPIALLVLASFWIFGTAPHETAKAAVEAPPPTVGRFVAAFLAVYFAYSGWNAVSYVAGEVKDVSKTLPFGLIGGTCLITILYLILAGAFAAALGMGGVQEAFEAGTTTATTLWGSAARWPTSALIAVALIGSVNATVIGGSRIAAAMGRDSVLPRPIGIWGRHSTPYVALWAQAAISTILILSGTFDALLELTSVAMLMLGAVVVGSLFVFRARDPDRTRPFRATGYPYLPAFYILTSFVVVTMSLYRALYPDEPASLIERLFPLLGIALFGVVYLVHRLARGDQKPLR